MPTKMKTIGYMLPSSKRWRHMLAKLQMIEAYAIKL